MSTTFSDHEWRVGAARANLRGFMHYVSPKQAYAWDSRHVRYVTEKLMAVERGEIKRLMIFEPPRHFKSQSASVHFPAWVLGRNPEKRIATTSYSSSLAETFSRQSRDKIVEYGQELFDIKVSSKSSAVDNWSLEGHIGGMVATGVGGSLTGKGCDILLIDDPHKDREEANSQTIRNKVWDWYTSTAYTRLEPDGAIILILTRWHEDDLAGRLIKAMEQSDGEQWDIVSFPAIAEQHDVLGRKLGEPLWPERFNLAKLQSIRVSIGSREFTSLYQQKPQALEGGAFKAPWIQWYTKKDITFENDAWYFRGQPLKIYQGVDPATTEKTYSDDFVNLTIAVTPAFEVLVFDVIADQFDPGDQANLIAENYLDWVPEQIGMEDNGGQKYLVAEVKKWHRTHPGHPIIKVRAITNTADKYSRITRNVPFVEAGGLYLRSSLPNEEGWIDMDRLPNVRIHPKMRKLYEQLVTFSPKMTHDDVADALDIAIDVGARKGMKRFFERRSLDGDTAREAGPKPEDDPRR